MDLMKKTAQPLLAQTQNSYVQKKIDVLKSQNSVIVTGTVRMALMSEQHVVSMRVFFFLFLCTVNHIESGINQNFRLHRYFIKILKQFAANHIGKVIRHVEKAPFACAIF